MSCMHAFSVTVIKAEISGLYSTFYVIRGYIVPTKI